MKFNLYDGLFKFECDWKAVAAIAVCVSMCTWFFLQ